ncbi:hypothetical protein K3217_17395 [bacterium BD-1]|uniref:hypothetical protein n=1 Tax=Arenimonas sp. TaxID=1872635 RepID=UPI001E4265AB|nr:hypothetical protein [Ottowia caeni]
MVHALLRAPLAGLLACALLAPAAAFAADPPPPNIIRLEPKPMEGLRAGRAVVVKGKAGPDGHRFLVEGLTAMMPVTVLLRPVRQGQDVRLQLSKYAWNQPLREGETEGGILKFKIRTEGEFQATVSAPEAGTAYRLLVWVGDEVKPEMRPVVVKASEFEEAGDGGGSLVLWVIAGLLGAGIVLLAILVLRRKPS